MLISDTALSARGLSTGPPRFRIVQSLTVNWDLLTLVQKLNFRFKWSQRNLVTSVKSYVWIILNSLTKEFTFVWDVERDVVVVRGCRNYVVASSNRVAPCQTACPAPTKTISNSLILRWDLGLAKSVLNLSWDQDLNLITETSSIIFNWNYGDISCIPGLAWEAVETLSPLQYPNGFDGQYTTMPNGKVLIAYSSFTNPIYTTKWVEFDPATLTYNYAIAQPTIMQRTDLAGKIIALSNGDILAVVNSSGDILGRSFTYDRGADAWTAVTSLPGDFSGFGLASINGGAQILKFGGRQRNNGFFYKYVYSYDTSTRIWSFIGDIMPLGLWYVDAVGLADGRVLMGGGETYSGVPNYRYWFYNPSTLVFTETTQVPTALYLHNFRHNIGILQLENGKVFMAGDRQTYAVLFDPVTESWSQFSIDSPITTFFNLSKLPDNERLLISGPTSYILTTC